MESLGVRDASFHDSSDLQLSNIYGIFLCHPVISGKKSEKTRSRLYGLALAGKPGRRQLLMRDGNFSTSAVNMIFEPSEQCLGVETPNDCTEVVCWTIWNGHPFENRDFWWKWQNFEVWGSLLPREMEGEDADRVLRAVGGPNHSGARFCHMFSSVELFSTKQQESYKSNLASKWSFFASFFRLSQVGCLTSIGESNSQHSA